MNSQFSTSAKNNQQTRANVRSFEQNHSNNQSVNDSKDYRTSAMDRTYGGEGRAMAPQNQYFSNPADSNEWIASMERENHYMARQIVQLEEDKRRRVNELHAASRSGQGNVVKLSEYEQVTKSLKMLEDKSSRLEKQLITAKEFIDKLSEATANDEQLIRQNESLQNQLADVQKRLEEEKALQEQVQTELTTMQQDYQGVQRELEQIRQDDTKIDFEKYDALIQEKQLIEQELKSLVEEKLTLTEQVESYQTEVDELKSQLSSSKAEGTKLRNQLASRMTESEEMRDQIAEFEEKQKVMEYDLVENQEKVIRLNRSIDKLQMELTDEKGKHLVDPKTSPEYVALLEENIRLRSADPKESASYLELLTEKNQYEQKYKAYNPKASKDYLELLVITERQRAQIAEMIANKEMIRITQEEIADILSEAQQKARKIIERSEEKAHEMIKEAEAQIVRRESSLNHYNDDLKAMVNTSVEAFRKLSDQAGELDDELLLAPKKY